MRIADPCYFRGRSLYIILKKIVSSQSWIERALMAKQHYHKSTVCVENTNWTESDILNPWTYVRGPNGCTEAAQEWVGRLTLCLPLFLQPPEQLFALLSNYRNETEDTDFIGPSNLIRNRPFFLPGSSWAPCQVIMNKVTLQLLRKTMSKIWSKNEKW